MTTKTEYYNGSDCSGSDGDSNRVLILSNTGITSTNEFLVYVSGLALSTTTEYTVVHKDGSTEITFLNKLWDDMTIIVQYSEKITGLGSDFELGPLGDFGVEVVRTPVTVTTDFSGNKNYTNGTNETIEVVFEVYNEKHNLDKSGLTKVYDAKMFLKPNQTLNKYDKITYDSKVYMVKEVSIRNFNGTTIFHVAGLFYLKEE